MIFKTLISRVGRMCLISPLVFILLLLGLSQVVPAQSMRAINTVPDQEKRSSIQTADGYAYLSEDMTISQTRAAAFANAKRLALESARSHIQSKTRVKDFQLEYDLVISATAGTVSILEQKDYGVENNVRYHVWIKAEVMYDLRPKEPEAPMATLMEKDAPLTVKVWTDKKNYRQGESIEIFVEGNRDFFARIVNIRSDGKIIQLLPNDYRPTNFFEGGKIYRIPDRIDKFDLEVSPPFGDENVVVYASEVPLGDVSMHSVGQGLRQYQGQLNGLAFQSRGIKIVGTSRTTPTGAEFYEATWTLTTRN